MISRYNHAYGRLFAAALAGAVMLLPTIVRAEDLGVYTCPVLHNLIATITTDTQSSDYKGVRYYFCCDGCKPQFDKDPGKYLNGLDARIKAAEQKKATEVPDKDSKK